MNDSYKEMTYSYELSVQRNDFVMLGHNLFIYKEMSYSYKEMPFSCKAIRDLKKKGMCFS